MTEETRLSPGDRVRVVSDWSKSTGYNHSGRMDHWLGQTVTIREVAAGGNYFIEEDAGEYPDNENHGGWFWNNSMFECTVDDEAEYGVSDIDVGGSVDGFFDM